MIAKLVAALLAAIVVSELSIAVAGTYDEKKNYDYNQDVCNACPKCCVADG